MREVNTHLQQHLLEGQPSFVELPLQTPQTEIESKCHFLLRGLAARQSLQQFGSQVSDYIASVKSAQAFYDHVIAVVEKLWMAGGQGLLKCILVKYQLHQGL